MMKTINQWHRWMPVKRKSARQLLFLTILMMAGLLYSGSAFAQQEVQGTVVDAQSGETLPGVNIRVQGSDTRGTVSDIDGNFNITLQSGENVLVFSYVGYTTQEVSIEGEQELFVELEPSVGELDELVVIGYGAVRKRDVTGAVSQVPAEEIGDFTTFNAEQSLQGKVSGVQVTSTSGAPGADASVRIRGVGTFNDSSPIYVVDGVILDNISFLNPSDIQSVEVLKDASATAIYGSRGANGVILIQTKTGAGLEAGSTMITVSVESGIQQLEQQIDLLNGREFATIANEIRPGSYNNVDAVPNTNWQDQIFDIAPMQNHQISVSGATENSDYYISVGYFQQSGIIDKSEYERLNLKINNNYNISDNVKLGNNITISPYRQRVAPNVTFAAYRAQPLLEPYYDDGSFGVVYNVGNPLASLEYSNNYNRGARIVGNVFGEFTIADDFMLRTSFGTDAALNRAENFTPAFTVFNPDGTESQQNNEYSDLFKGETLNYNLLWENTLNYIKDIDKHSVNAVVGLTMQQIKSEILELSGQNVIRSGDDFWYIQPSYIIDEANNINTLSSISNRVDANQYFNMMSYLGRMVYSYDDKYTATLTLRRDGSSKFSEENRWGTFPSAAVGWNMEREAFLQDVAWLDNLKLRGSWGMIGNEKITYYDRFARVDAGLLAVFGNPDATFNAATYGKSGNPDLKWETTTQTDVGLEVGMLDRRLTGEFDFYNRVTDDILIELATPGHLGNGQGQRVRYNAASVLNRGFEFRLNWEDYLGEEFSYGITVLGNTIHNEVQDIGGNSEVDDELIGGALANGQRVTRSVVGQPIGSFYGYKTDGIFQNQSELDSYPSMSLAGVGDLRFVDTNEDGQINGDDRTYIGSPIPDFVYGFEFDLAYKNWDMSVAFQGQYGNELFNGKNVVRPDPYNFEQHVWDRWTGEGTSDSEPRPSYGGYNFLPSDRFIQDGSYLRLRSINLGYSLPSTLMNKINMTRARVYVKANNLFTWTSYSGYTPEIGSGDVLSNGIDTGIYPIPRVISIGINTTF